MEYVILGLLRLVGTALWSIWWVAFLPLALLVFGIRLLGGDPDAERELADSAALVYFVVIPIGLFFWCVVVGLLWWTGVLGSWVSYIGA